MPLVLPDAFDDAELPNGSEDYLWLVEVTLQKSNRTGTDPAAFTPPLVLRVCNNYEPIVWPVSNPLTQNWSPYSFAISPIESSSEGDLPVLQLQIDNTGRDLMATLQDGVTEAHALLMKAYEAYLAEPGLLPSPAVGEQVEGLRIVFAPDMPGAMASEPAARRRR